MKKRFIKKWCNVRKHKFNLYAKGKIKYIKSCTKKLRQYRPNLLYMNNLIKYLENY